MTIVQAQYKPVPERFPEGLRNLIHRCLSKQPADRPSIKEILADPYVVKYVATMRERSLHQGGMEHAGMSFMSVYASAVSHPSTETVAASTWEAPLFSLA